MSSGARTKHRSRPHPYLAGNFAPVKETVSRTPCSYSGTIPRELFGGQYVRNGGNSILNEELGRDYHWFDGDGMLSGVHFTINEDESVTPYFANQHILTDLYLAAASTPTIRSHIVPSISTLINPATTLLRLCLTILRTLFIVLLSHLPGSSHSIKRISVTNTNLFYHDGRALATCESGPPIRVQLPGLETVGWYDGWAAEGERAGSSLSTIGFGGGGLLGFMKEWTTGHPKVDPVTGELVLYHCTFTAPYVHYSIIPASQTPDSKKVVDDRPVILNVPVPGVSGAKMMHDFGVSATNTIIMDIPLSLDPFNLMRGKPVVTYDPHSATRFGVFPRRNPADIQWFETDPCCIFHTANTWDEPGSVDLINLLVCRLTSPATIFVAGNVDMPVEKKNGDIVTKNTRPPFFGKYDFDEVYEDASGLKIQPAETTTELVNDEVFEQASMVETGAISNSLLEDDYIVPEEEQCRLYFYQFDTHDRTTSQLRQQFALSAMPFEFPTVHPAKEMSAARYVYGCSTSTASFNVALGKTVKIDTLVKADVLDLIQRGSQGQLTDQCVDHRTVQQVIRDNVSNENDSLKCFKMPAGWYAQEARLVPREDAKAEDDGYLLFYAFNEAQLDIYGECPDTAASELWMLDARNMRDVVCRIHLPQRVPYGFHGNFFSREQIEKQRDVVAYRTLEQTPPSWAKSVHDTMIGRVG